MVGRREGEEERDGGRGWRSEGGSEGGGSEEGGREEGVSEEGEGGEGGREEAGRNGRLPLKKKTKKVKVGYHIRRVSSNPRIP